MNTLNVKDLRIGNYIYDDDSKLCKINGFSPFSHSTRCDELEGCNILFDTYMEDRETSKGWECNSNEIKPIPLSEEWLLKFGLRQDEDRHFTFPKYDRFHIYHPLGEFMSFCDGDFWICNKIAFVHQLQNLYFAIFGEELITDKTYH